MVDLNPTITIITGNINGQNILVLAEIIRIKKTPRSNYVIKQIHLSIKTPTG